MMTINRMLPGAEGIAIIKRLREHGVTTPALIVIALARSTIGRGLHRYCARMTGFAIDDDDVVQDDGANRKAAYRGGASTRPRNVLAKLPAAQKGFRRLEGHRQLLKLVLGVKFADGFGVTKSVRRQPATTAA